MVHDPQVENHWYRRSEDTVEVVIAELECTKKRGILSGPTKSVVITGPAFLIAKVVISGFYCTCDQVLNVDRS